MVKVVSLVFAAANSLGHVRHRAKGVLLLVFLCAGKEYSCLPLFWLLLSYIFKAVRIEGHRVFSSHNIKSIDRMIDLFQWSNRPLSRYSCFAKVWSNTWIRHTIGKNKPSLVSAPIFRVTDQSTVKCHHFENCNFYKDLCVERARLDRSAHLPYKTR